VSFFRNPRNVVIIGLTAVLVVIAVYAVLLNDTPGSVTSPPPATFTVNGKTYAFNYTASDNAERAAGLMNEKVTNATTMLFAFPSMGTYEFWMYDTNTSLDIIWINATGNMGRVVYVYTDALPCRSIDILCPDYGSSALANYVIEARAGFAAANDLGVGTRILFG